MKVKGCSHRVLPAAVKKEVLRPLRSRKPLIKGLFLLMWLDVFLSAEFRSVKAAGGTRRALALTERNPAGYPVCKPHKDLQALERLFFPGSAVRRCFLFGESLGLYAL